MTLITKQFYEFGPFRLDPAEGVLLRDGRAISLTPKAFGVLRVIVEHHGHTVTKENLLKAVWPDTFVEEGNLAFHVSLVRKALGEAENGQGYIETVTKRGYRFIVPVKEVSDHLPISPNLEPIHRTGSWPRNSAWILILVLVAAGLLSALLLLGSRSHTASTSRRIMLVVLPV